MTEAPDFCHLHVHSHFSLLDGACRIEELVAAAIADGQRALGITDHGNLFGAIPFYKTCQDRGIKPILGIEAYLAGRSRKQKADAGDNPTYHITLLAQSDVGWRNLIKLSSISFKDGFYRKPRIDREAMAEHADGIIALSGCLGGEVNQRVLQGDLRAARAAVDAMCEIFGRQNFYLELMNNGYRDQPACIAALRRIGADMGLPVVATNDVHYIRPSDSAAQDILLCINTGKVVHDDNRFRMESEQLYFKTRAEMAQVFHDCPDALRSTVEIAERCNVQIEFGKYHLPKFVPEHGETPDELFVRLCQEGVRERYGEVTPRIEERLAHEIEVVRKLGFVSYFLIVWDFIRFARDNGVAVGPGRGSAAGSIVAYALRITDIDPLRYDLLFERFLNAERISMPDIDIDFCREGREKVIDYVRQKYGKENVSQIITFGTMASRGVIRDVGRALDIQLRDVDQIAKKVPQGPGASLRAALTTDHELKALRHEDEQKAQLFEIGLKLEGLCRHASTHAAGVVIADKPLQEYVPLYRNGDDITTQWQMTDLEDVGLLKMDFLGLKTLTIIEEARRLIRARTGRNIDFTSLEMDDARTYGLLSSGNTLGVFQVESGGMRDLITRLQPSCFEDVIALIALYRPGPLQSGMAETYVKRKHGQEEVDYPHASLEPILKDTYGVIVYQEQVMLIAHHLARFSLNEADSLRKAMGKKKPEVMALFRQKFVEGAVRNGHDAKFADELFRTMEYFAGYGFNKSHSAAYAVLTYRTAWLKANYPTEFMCALLTCDIGVSDKVKEFLDEARRMGIRVLPPDVNRSGARFTVEDDRIRFGLSALKGLGEKAAASLVESRRSDGPFSDIFDLAKRWDLPLANRTAFEVLCKSGALESTGWSRRAAFGAIDGAMKEASQIQSDLRRGQSLMFSTPRATETQRDPPAAEEWPEHVKLAMEKEAIGFFLSGHPFEKRGRFFSLLAGCDTRKLRELGEDDSPAEVVLAGMITGLRSSVIKNGRNAGQRMARFRLEDLEGSVSATVFSKQYQVVKHRLQEDALVFVRARLDRSGDEPGILVDDVLDVGSYIAENVESLVVHLAEDQHTASDLRRVRDQFERVPGRHSVQFRVRDRAGRHYRLFPDARFKVKLSEELLDGLTEALGMEALSFTRR